MGISDVWSFVQDVVTWTPALTVDSFSSPKSKKLFKEFQYTLYSSMLTKALAGNIIFYVLLLIVQLSYFISNMKEMFISTGFEGIAGGILLHVAAFSLHLVFPWFFRSTRFVFIFASLLLSHYICNISSLMLPGTLVHTCNAIVLLLMATIYFQNSTLFLCLSCLIEFLLSFVGKIILVSANPETFPGSVPVWSEVSIKMQSMTYNFIFPQVPALILLTLSVIVLCLSIHILNCINTRNAFTCIEYNTVANIYVKKEIDNQVRDKLSSIKFYY